MVQQGVMDCSQKAYGSLVLCEDTVVWVCVLAGLAEELGYIHYLFASILYSALQLKSNSIQSHEATQM